MADKVIIPLSVILNKALLGKLLWSEDDALPHDRETLHSAIPRITGMDPDRKKRNPDFTIDAGDCTWEVYPKWVICNSYPGNTAIYKRKERKVR